MAVRFSDEIIADNDVANYIKNEYMCNSNVIPGGDHIDILSVAENQDLTTNHLQKYFLDICELNLKIILRWFFKHSVKFLRPILFL